MIGFNCFFVSMLKTFSMHLFLIIFFPKLLNYIFSQEMCMHSLDFCSEQKSGQKECQVLTVLNNIKYNESIQMFSTYYKTFHNPGKSCSNRFEKKSWCGLKMKWNSCLCVLVSFSYLRKHILNGITLRRTGKVAGRINMCKMRWELVVIRMRTRRGGRTGVAKLNSAWPPRLCSNQNITCLLWVNFCFKQTSSCHCFCAIKRNENWMTAYYLEHIGLGRRYHYYTCGIHLRAFTLRIHALDTKILTQFVQFVLITIWTTRLLDSLSPSSRTPQIISLSKFFFEQEK